MLDTELVINRNLDSLCAENVMHWTLMERYENGSALWSYGKSETDHATTGIPSCGWNWSPTTNAAHTKQIRDAMVNLGYAAWHIGYLDGVYACEFLNEKLAADFDATAETEEMAIVLAALKAVEFERLTGSRHRFYSNL